MNYHGSRQVLRRQARGYPRQSRYIDLTTEMNHRILEYPGQPVVFAYASWRSSYRGVVFLFVILPRDDASDRLHADSVTMLALA